eukprot:1993416-Amphidinium_carterae.1
MVPNEERVMSLLALTAIHSVMKMNVLLPEVQMEHAPFEGYKAWCASVMAEQIWNKPKQIQNEVQYIWAPCTKDNQAKLPIEDSESQ